jgi:ABC-type transport system involved in cytochrome c biogenesis permease component
LAGGIRHGGNLLALFMLPMAVPVVLASAEATRLVAQGDFGVQWWRWIQLLGAFAIIFITAGTLLFDFLVED